MSADGSIIQSLVNNVLVSCFLVQLGSDLKLTVFKSESTGAALKGWAKAAKKKHKDPNHVHEALSEHERQHGRTKLGIIGLNKALDEHGHAVDAPLGTKLHNDHVGPHHHKTSHLPDAHSRTQGTQSSLLVSSHAYLFT